MSFPLFRFTLTNAIEGSMVISEPGGWDEATFKLQRSDEYHSLVEFYDQSLLFYGSSNDGNGGMDWINLIENTQGPDAQIEILIEISQDDGVSYETAYDGLIDITSFKQQDFYKQEGGIIRNDFWQKFINRKAINVDLSSTTDLDGGTRSVISSGTLTLPSQAIRQQFAMIPETFGTADSDDYTGLATTLYLMFGVDETSLDEITERFDYGTQISEFLPTDVDKYLFKVTYGGSYLIDVTVNYLFVFSSIVFYDIRWFYAIRTGGALTTTQFGSTNSGGASLGADSFGFTATLFTTITLNAGDEIYIYGKIIESGAVPIGQTIFYPVDNGHGIYTTFTITADTLYPETSTEDFTVFNAAQSILTKLVAQDSVLESTYLTAPNCGAYYGLTRGLNVRGYSLFEKPFFMSFDTFWNGLNPILNLGLGYTTVLGVDKIEILEKEDFYNPTPSLYLDFVNNIERSYNEKLIFKSIDVGYEKWSAESGSGIDDPQSKRTFRTRFKTVGEDIRIESKFFAASLGIEQTRRNRKEANQDWRLDEDVMIIALNKADTTLPELGSAFSGISDLLNSATRYNIRISATRNLYRWLSYLNGCLKWYSTDDDFTFSSGEGNFAMTSTMSGGDCEDGSVVENGTIDGGADQSYNFVPILYDFVCPLTWDQYKTIRDNRKNAIGVSRTDSGHVTCFIMNLEFKITQNQGSGKFTVLLGQSTPI